MAGRVAVGLVADHALGEQAGERLLQLEIAAAGQRPHEEARIEQMQHGMLDPADILVDRQPVVGRRPLERLARLGRAEAGEVPAALEEGVEGVGLALGGPAASRTSDVLPGRVTGQRIAGAGQLDILRQGHRQLGARHRHDAAALAVDDRDRAAPVALARHAPVAQTVGHPALAVALAGQPVDHPALGAGHVQAVEEAGIEQPAVADIGLVGDRELGGIGVRRQHHRGHRPAIFAGEVEIALVMGRAAEDRAGAIVHQHEIGDVDWQTLVRLDRIAADQAGVVALLLGALDRLLAGAQLGAGLNEGGQVRVLRGAGGGQRMIGRDRHEAGAEQRVGAGREDLERLGLAIDREADQSALGAADPVLLHPPDLVRPALQLGQAGQQLVAIGGDLQEPLRQLAPLDQRPRAPATAIDHLLIGEHGLIDRVPIDRRLLAIDQAGLEKVEEHRLLVPVVVRIASRQLARPVERQAHAFELVAHLRDVGIGPGGGMHALGHGGILGRQAEGVPAHRMEHVEALGALEAGDHVAQRVVAHMAHMDPARGVGKHLEHVIFRAGGLEPSDEGLALVPDRLPLGLGCLEGVA